MSLLALCASEIGIILSYRTLILINGDSLALNLLPLHAAGSVRLICERRAESQRVISAFEYHSRAVMQLQITSRLARYVCLLRASIFRRHAKCLRVIKNISPGGDQNFLGLAHHTFEQLGLH
jgi:hypothetical protein